MHKQNPSSSNSRKGIAIVPIAVLIILVLLAAYGIHNTKDLDRSFDQATSYQAEVSSVTDGDTIDVRLENGSKQTVRLLGIDTPEKFEQPTKEYKGVSDTGQGRGCLLRWGQNATKYMENRLGSKSIELVIDPKSDRRGDYDRLLSYVRVNGTDLNLELIQKGYARVYRSEFSREKAYIEAEKETRNARRGLWSCIKQDESGVVVSETNFDAVGREKQNLNSEYVTLSNMNSSRIDISGWRITDEYGYNYTFSERYLEKGQSVRLHTGIGVDNVSDVYWNRTSAVWNNDGDTVYLFDSVGRKIYSAYALG